MRITNKQLQALTGNKGKRTSTKSQRTIRDALPRTPPPQAIYTSGDGYRYLVEVESVRKRLLDEDNLCVKYFVDQLRYSRIIPDDRPAMCSISVRQRKPKEGEEEHTRITVHEIPPPSPTVLKGKPNA